MGYKKKTWFNVRKKGYKVFIEIKDEDWRSIRTVRCNANELPSVLKSLNEQFGIPIEVKTTEEDIKEEMNFLNKDTEW